MILRFGPRSRCAARQTRARRMTIDDRDRPRYRASRPRRPACRARCAAYALLARFDRPIGWWLLFWPGAWGVALAGGAVARLGADRCGCCSARSRCAARAASITTSSTAISTRRSRARAAGRCRAGAVSLKAAWAWLLVLCADRLRRAAAARLARRGGRAGQPRAGRRLSVHEAHHLVAAGMAGAGLLLGGAGRLGGDRRVELALRRCCCSMPASISWVVGYDTIYALQDREDDALVGVRSSARRDGAACRGRASRLLSAPRWRCWAAAFWQVRPDPLALVALLPVALHLGWQVATLDPGRRRRRARPLPRQPLCRAADVPAACFVVGSVTAFDLARVRSLSRARC